MSQIGMFTGRGSTVAGVVEGSHMLLSWSSTWDFRRALMLDFLVRAACPRMEFRFTQNRKQVPLFPSHWVPPFDYYVTGDDGTRWHVGSRGNSLEILRQEVIYGRRRK